MHEVIMKAVILLPNILPDNFGDTICINNNTLVASRIIDYVDKGLDYQIAS